MFGIHKCLGYCGNSRFDTFVGSLPHPSTGFSLRACGFQLPFSLIPAPSFGMPQSPSLKPHEPLAGTPKPTSEKTGVTYVPATVNYVPTYVPATVNNAHSGSGCGSDAHDLIKSLSPRLGSFPPDLIPARRRRSRISQQRRDSQAIIVLLLPGIHGPNCLVSARDLLPQLSCFCPGPIGGAFAVQTLGHDVPSEVLICVWYCTPGPDRPFARDLSHRPAPRARRSKSASGRKYGSRTCG